MKKIICFACFSAFALTSCSSSSNSSPASESDVLLKKSVETYANDGSTVTTNYTYNGKKLLSSIDSDDVREDFTYTGDLITNIKIYDGTTLMEEQFFTYNSSNQLITYVAKYYDSGDANRETYVYNSDGSVSSTNYTGDTTTQTTPFSTGTIHLANGDVTRVDLDVTDVSSYTSTVTYTYDTKNSPYKNITGIDKISFIAGESSGTGHNILTDHYTSSLSSDITTTTTYTYNSLNFPLTNSEIEGTDATSVITTQYTYN